MGNISARFSYAVFLYGQCIQMYEMSTGWCWLIINLFFIVRLSADFLAPHSFAFDPLVNRIFYSFAQTCFSDIEAFTLFMSRANYFHSGQLADHLHEVRCIRRFAFVSYPPKHPRAKAGDPRVRLGQRPKRTKSSPACRWF
jgi:hypothetical protein